MQLEKIIDCYLQIFDRVGNSLELVHLNLFLQVCPDSYVNCMCNLDKTECCSLMLVNRPLIVLIRNEELWKRVGYILFFPRCRRKSEQGDRMDRRDLCVQGVQGVCRGAAMGLPPAVRADSHPRVPRLHRAADR